MTDDPRALQQRMTDREFRRLYERHPTRPESERALIDVDALFQRIYEYQMLYLERGARRDDLVILINRRDYRYLIDVISVSHYAIYDPNFHLDTIAGMRVIARDDISEGRAYVIDARYRLELQYDKVITLPLIGLTPRYKPDNSPALGGQSEINGREPQLSRKRSARTDVYLETKE